MDKGLISNIQTFSIDDGPGIRTCVFMQACNLACPWCHNPETISKGPCLLFYRDLCTMCGYCSLVCGQGVHSFLEGKHHLDLARCIHCGKCEEVCNGALKLSGRLMSVDEVFDYIMKDYQYYVESGGGVTFSGGEGLLQADFLAKLAKRLKEKDINIILDTAGSVNFLAFEKLIPFIDTYYYDLKGDRSVYDKYPVGNYDLVVGNLRTLKERGLDILVRIPVIPGVNDDIGVMGNMSRVLKEIGIEKLSFLPFHNLGSGKYKALNLEYDFMDISF